MPDPNIDPNGQANGAQPDPQAGAPDQGAGGQQAGQGQPGGAAPQTFTIDGVAYTEDQVRQLAKDKKDYDAFLPEFHQRSQILSNPEQLKKYIATKYPDLLKPAAPAAAPGSPEEEEARTQAWLKERGFLTKEEAAKLADQAYEKREADKAVQEERKSLEAEWDGKDGKPKFDYQEVLKHAVENGFPSLKSAFRELKFDALNEWFAANKAKPKAPVIAAPGGAQPPVGSDKKVRLDDGSFDEAAEQFGL